jgi:hypothetical protein
MLVDQYERIGHRSNAGSNISEGRAVWFGQWKELTPAAGTAKLRDTGGKLVVTVQSSRALHRPPNAELPPIFGLRGHFTSGDFRVRSGQVEASHRLKQRPGNLPATF